MLRRLLCLAIGSLALGWALPASAQLAVTAISITPGAGGTEVVHFLTNAGVTPKKVFSLSDPDRIAIDLPLVEADGVSLPPGYRGTLVRSVRFGHFDKDTSRIVIDLAGPVATSMTSGMTEFSLTLLPVGITGKTVVSPFNALDKGTPASPVVAEGVKPLIIIDAGHGGQDPGAAGLRKTQEKEITLAYANVLKDALLRTGRYRVAMTRANDRFIMLADRVSMGRRAKGDIFISLHADFNPKKDAEGLSIYTLSENASDDEAAALAERENKADVLSGINLNGADDDVASILIDLAQRETMNKSSRFADAVVDSLHTKITTLPRTHRFAGFRVLKAPDIPSVLIELGFLSNKEDEKRLSSLEYQSLIVSSIIKGIDRHLAQEKL